MDDKKTVMCTECQNRIAVPEDTRAGDVIECEFCGSELRITGLDADGNVTIQVIEEEK